MNLARQIQDRVLGRLTGTITQVETLEPMVSLTFDDGPNPAATPQLLDILASYGAKGTFFMLGSNARRFPQLLKRVFDEGHTVANHSFDHPSFAYLTSRERRTQLRLCESALAPYGQKFFRPPYGNQTLGSWLDAQVLGYQVVTWNLVAHDWLDYDAQRLAGNVAEEIAPGSLVLLHDGLNDSLEPAYADRTPMLQAVELLLEQFCGDYQFVTLPRLLAAGRAIKQSWRMKTAPDFLNRLHYEHGMGHRYSRSRRVSCLPTGAEGAQL